tara:strand:+ start:2392 stop:3030 length:639 start_codon:yes stop_codon:yes gene_type:complete
MLFNPGIIPQSNYNSNSNLGQLFARDSGPVSEYIYIESKPKKQLKELQKNLLPEKKKFLFIKYSYKFNLRNNCVICGSMHQWEVSDPMRPPLPLSEVIKGRPLKGTYCPKHAGYYKQFEMLEQKILAEENGIEFRTFIPKPKIPSIRRGPLNTLTSQDMASLISMGWVIEPPKGTKETGIEQYTRLMVDIQGKLVLIQKIIPILEMSENGEK